MLTLSPEEPEATPWAVRPLADVAAELLAVVGAPLGRPGILAVDGRSGSGKSTFSSRLAALVPGSAVVHTDDVAWWESFFGWDHLMAGGILEPLHRGEPVAYRPPAWDARGREGAIEVAASTRLLIVEGDGSSRRSLTHLLDGAVWVQSDAAEARRRGIERDGGDAAAEEFWDEWDGEEVPFFATDRPWERADLVICGTPHQVGTASGTAAWTAAATAYEVAREVVVGRHLRP